MANLLRETPRTKETLTNGAVSSFRMFPGGPNDPVCLDLGTHKRTQYHLAMHPNEARRVASMLLRAASEIEAREE